MRIIYDKTQNHEQQTLHIGVDDWQEAVKIMNQSEFALYLYLAGAPCEVISKKSFEKATGFRKTMYYDGIKELKRLGYLTARAGNVYEFHTHPVRNDGRAPQEETKTFGEILFK